MHSADYSVMRFGDINGHVGRHIDGFDGFMDGMAEVMDGMA